MVFEYMLDYANLSPGPVSVADVQHREKEYGEDVPGVISSFECWWY